MAKIKVKGHEFEAVTAKDSFNRRALQHKNNIIATLGRIGLTVDDVEIELERNAAKKAGASASWYVDKRHLHFSHSLRDKYVDNLYVVFKVIDLETTALLEERITPEEYISEFSEDTDVAKKREEARDVLGLGHDVNDMKVIDKAYKDLAKKHHPDTDSGDAAKFKEINHAHKVLKRELR